MFTILEPLGEACVSNSECASGICFPWDFNGVPSPKCMLNCIINNLKSIFNRFFFVFKAIRIILGQNSERKDHTEVSRKLAHLFFLNYY
jgi:hypothetical protein